MEGEAEMTYTIGSLFSGYGGLDMGVQLALGPARTAWVSDIEPGPCALLAHHWPDAPNLGDITTVDWTQVEPVDVIAGGSPCQDLSTAGRRAGMKPGTRSGLWESMFHAITTIRPHLVVWENVRGALSAGAFSLIESREGRVGDPADGPVLRALGRVLGDLASIGYDAQWVGLRASDVGAPHQRYRVFVAAHPQGDTWWLQHRDGATAGDAHGETLWVESIDVGGGRSAHEFGGAGEDPVRLLPTPTTQDTDPPCVSQLDRNTVPLNTLVTLLPTHRCDNNENRQSSGYGQNLGNALAESHGFGAYSGAVRRWEQVTRPAPNPTESSAGGSDRLSPAFVEWMMGLTAGWVTDVGITRTQQLRALGNGVVPQQASTAIRLMRDREWQIQRYGEVAA